MALWNIKDLPMPPINTYKAKNKMIDIEHLYDVLKEAIRFLDDEKYMHAEYVVLSRIVYRMKQKFRSAKDFKALEKVNKALDNYFKMDITRNLKTFMQLVPSRYKSETYLPTKNLLDYILVRLQGVVKLMERIVDTCKIAAYLLDKRLHIGHFWKIAFITFSIVSRIYVLAKYTARFICEFYRKLIPFSSQLKNTSEYVSPYSVPKDLKEWMNVDWLESDDDIQVIEVSTELPDIMQFFDLVEDDDDVQFCEEYVMINDDEDQETEKDLRKISSKNFKNLWEMRGFDIREDIGEIIKINESLQSPDENVSDAGNLEVAALSDNSVQFLSEDVGIPMSEPEHLKMFTETSKIGKEAVITLPDTLLLDQNKNGMKNIVGRQFANKEVQTLKHDINVNVIESGENSVITLSDTPVTEKVDEHLGRKKKKKKKTKKPNQIGDISSMNLQNLWKMRGLDIREDVSVLDKPSHISTFGDADYLDVTVMSDNSVQFLSEDVGISMSEPENPNIFTKTSKMEDEAVIPLPDTSLLDQNKKEMNLNADKQEQTLKHDINVNVNKSGENSVIVLSDTPVTEEADENLVKKKKKKKKTKKPNQTGDVSSVNLKNSWKMRGLDIGEGVDEIIEINERTQSPNENVSVPEKPSHISTFSDANNLDVTAMSDNSVQFLSEDVGVPMSELENPNMFTKTSITLPDTPIVDQNGKRMNNLVGKKFSAGKQEQTLKHDINIGVIECDENSVITLSDTPIPETVDENPSRKKKKKTKKLNETGNFSSKSLKKLWKMRGLGIREDVGDITEINNRLRSPDENAFLLGKPSHISTFSDADNLDVITVSDNSIQFLSEYVGSPMSEPGNLNIVAKMSKIEGESVITLPDTPLVEQNKKLVRNFNANKQEQALKRDMNASVVKSNKNSEVAENPSRKKKKKTKKPNQTGHINVNRGFTDEIKNKTDIKGFSHNNDLNASFKNNLMDNDNNVTEKKKKNKKVKETGGKIVEGTKLNEDVHAVSRGTSLIPQNSSGNDSVKLVVKNAKKRKLNQNSSQIQKKKTHLGHVTVLPNLETNNRLIKQNEAITHDVANVLKTQNKKMTGDRPIMLSHTVGSGDCSGSLTSTPTNSRKRKLEANDDHLAAKRNKAELKRKKKQLKKKQRLAGNSSTELTWGLSPKEEVKAVIRFHPVNEGGNGGTKFDKKIKKKQKKPVSVEMTSSRDSFKSTQKITSQSKYINTFGSAQHNNQLLQNYLFKTKNKRKTTQK